MNDICSPEQLHSTCDGPVRIQFQGYVEAHIMAAGRHYECPYRKNQKSPKDYENLNRASHNANRLESA
jgi:hypothetical protein